MASATITQARPIITVQAPPRIPEHLQLSLEGYPKLNAQQAGHIRHFHNLVSQKDGSWNHMGAEDPGQELFDAYRYQLSNMAYAASLTHYHRLPALRSVFKPLLRNLIHKMLRRDVWGYWFNTSMGGSLLDPDLKELRKPWADPVIRENIMYSGHLLLMISLYAMLFDDDEFENPESIVFEWDPRFFGFGAEKFKYSTSELQNIILNEMEGNGWVGVCCEPNVVFVVCNQFPLIAIRYNDVRHNVALLDEILVKYQAAWQKKGMVGPTGLFAFMWMKNQDLTIPAVDLNFTAWAGAFMNTWNSGLVHSMVDQQISGFITNINGENRLQTASVANNIRRLVAEKPAEHDANSAKTLASAIAHVEEHGPITGMVLEKGPTLGYALQLLSEVGRGDLLSGLLNYADSRLQPTWEHGGLFYPRNDELRSADWDWTYVDPYTGNSAIAYARLNVPGGQKKMFDKPWTKDYLTQRPYIDGVDLAQGVDFLRGDWIERENAVVITMKAWDGKEHRVEPVVEQLGRGHWAIYVNGQLQWSEEVAEAGTLSVPVTVGGEDEVDVVVLRV